MTLAPEHPLAPERLTTRVELLVDQRWLAVCDLAALTPGRGVAALLPDGRQVAVFLDRGGAVYAIGNQDPFTGAYVLSRGLVGRTAEDGGGAAGEADGGNPAAAGTDGPGARAFVASPLLKQRFCLTTGRCLDDASVTVPAFAVRVG
ncbi:nitrite reductase (NAD(P)H) small subunit [Streptomyces sp. NPDC001922]|uniref:nitrite reductase (NAD(P)H) small subunit n=1 Tax=Streptomyces sp. NPDC001922 TaxID=3364624 RepID=UPI00367CA3D6